MNLNMLFNQKLIFSLFYTDDTSSEPPSTNEEPSILEPGPDGEPPIAAERVTFQLVERGTKRGKTSLIDSQGFTYNVHSRRPYTTYWQCTMRPKGNPCQSSVTERDGIFQAGKSAHNHAVARRGGGYFLMRGYWGCVAGWGRIFTTGLTIMGLHF